MHEKSKTFTLKNCKCGNVYYEGKTQILRPGDLLEITDIQCGKCKLCGELKRNPDKRIPR